MKKSKKERAERNKEKWGKNNKRDGISPANEAMVEEQEFCDAK